MSHPRPITYDYGTKGSILLPKGAPFDGEPILIQLAEGWTEAWWCKAEYERSGMDDEETGFCWVCLDDKFCAELDEARNWAPLPSIHSPWPDVAIALVSSLLVLAYTLWR